jgi:hypothetical protein
MSALKALVLDPALEELLQAVASDPDSTLLRFARSGRVHGPYAALDPGRVSSVGGTSAERALLDTHRAELAGLLADAAMDRLVFGEQGRRHLGRFDVSGTERIRPSREQLRRQIAGLPQGIEAEHGNRAMSLLEACVASSSDWDATSRTLASVAFALQPSLRTRGVYAYSLWAAGECDGALAHAVRWIEAGPRSQYLPHAWELVCIVRAQQGRMVDAHSAQVRGLECPTPTAIGMMNRLTMAAQAGLEHEVRPAARALDEALSDDDPRVADYLAMSNSRRGPRGWLPTTAAGAIVNSNWVRDAEGPSRRILDALR